MENAGYTTLTRQAGLMREMQVIANNIANAATTGYRQEGLIFSEHVTRAGDGPSLSMASANVRNTDSRRIWHAPNGNHRSKWIFHWTQVPNNHNFKYRTQRSRQL